MENNFVQYQEMSNIGVIKIGKNFFLGNYYTSFRVNSNNKDNLYLYFSEHLIEIKLEFCA